jgi:hypothetical protein
MFKKLRVLFLLTFLFCLSVGIVQATDIMVGANQNIITSTPPLNAKIIDSGYGDVRAPEYNYYAKNWSIADNNIVYVWNDVSNINNGTNSRVSITAVTYIIVAVVVIISVIAAGAIMSRRRN